MQALRYNPPLGDTALFDIQKGAFRMGAEQRKDPNKPMLRELYNRLPVPPLKKQFAVAWDFQRVCGARAVLPLLKLLSLTLIGLVLAVSAFGGLAYLGVRYAKPFPLQQIDRWPLLLVAGVIGGVCSSTLVFAASALATFRITNRIRRFGRFKPELFWKELGLALESVGIVGSAVWGLTMSAASVVLALLAGGLAMLLLQLLHAPIPVVAAVAFALFLPLYWLLIVYPQVYVLAILAQRDAGWMRGFEASLALIRLEGRNGLIKALAASAAALTVVGIPFAVALLLATMDRADLLVAAVLNEKTLKEIDDELNQHDASQQSALTKFDDLLARGRYLDALNGYQMYLRAHREDVEAIRGEALAMLHMGNLRALESLERWQRLEPESNEAANLLIEFHEGLWAADGERYLAAQARCTQPVGRGI